MKHAVHKFKAHYIVCGAGNTGLHIIEELVATNREFVVIESSLSAIARVHRQFPKAVVIEGDAGSDDVLFDAGIEKAAGLVSVLHSDKDNLFEVVCSRRLNSDLRIISKIVDMVNKHNFIAAGANSVVSPSSIGAARLSSELLRPNVVTYMDDMMKDHRNVRVEEIRIPENSWVIGKKLTDLQIGKRLGIQVIAVRDANKTDIDYSPTGDYECAEGSVLIITATPDKVVSLSQFVSEKRGSDR